MNNFFKKAFFALFPKMCVCCKRITRSGFLCHDCREEYEKELSDGCLSCGNPYARCRCDAKYLDNEKLIYAIPYKNEGVSREMLLKMKTSNNRELASHLASKMASALEENGVEKDYIITYVPRSPVKIRLEVVDQAKILAYALSRETSVECEELFLCRSGMKEQKSLHYEERDIYARSRFSLKLGAEKRIKGKSFVLVDDIITSGATVKICSELLYEAGARDVICLSASRSVSK